MNLYGGSILCTAALLMMASSLARAADPDGIAPDQQVEVLLRCDLTTVMLAPSCAGVRSDRICSQPDSWLSNSAPAYLLLKPGADNLGYATITTFLPLENPQWAVQTLNPRYQPGFSVGGRYVFPCSGKDIRVNWEHLRTSDSASVAVSDPTTQWISPFNQTGPSTSEQANEVGVFHLKSASGQVDFDYDMVNIDVGQTVNIGSNTQLRLFAGLSLRPAAGSN